MFIDVYIWGMLHCNTTFHIISHSSVGLLICGYIDRMYFTLFNGSWLLNTIYDCNEQWRECMPSMFPLHLQRDYWGLLCFATWLPADNRVLAKRILASILGLIAPIKASCCIGVQYITTQASGATNGSQKIIISICVLIERWNFRRRGWVGVIYPANQLLTQHREGSPQHLEGKIR